MMIRVATKEDSDAIVDLCLASRKKHMSFTQPAHTEDEIRNWMREELIPNQKVEVLEEDSEIKAMIATKDEKSESWITHLFVEAQSVRKGYGRKLLEKALAELKKPIRLYAFQENHRARQFYERFGFRAILFSDGSTNEEKCPDVLYELKNDEPNQALQTTSASARRLS
ncbi:GNAT family N-acetyltransferase [Pelagicoccus sp. SDUM812002]|uniref:GNAT family N-acetyltransferase n=1 Tax=Pelagicoccus sp. SDUM812002 TaxID=3041266 RepID=UPI00280DB669|nr:GNAT family N-acetyltransferase [Pelagicoccus sp. SDUM812002]MDQ8188526.1 GNAT family N-acetyltransferase [Pelagicoccus sp. SDUM812002]